MIRARLPAASARRRAGFIVLLPGEATARLLAERGAAVVLGARRTERLDQIAQQIRDGGGRAIAFAIEQPYDVEIGDITIRPAVQG